MNIRRDIKKIIDKEFWDYNGYYYHKGCLGHHFLCDMFGTTKYAEEWNDFWEQINDEDLYSIGSYLEDGSEEEHALLRLLSVHDFINWLESL